MATRIQLRRGTSAQWTAANPILASGEIGIELDTFQWKVGDGTTAWADRPYVASGTVTLPEGGDLDDVPDGILYKKLQAAFATAINGETFDAASVLNAGIGGAAKSVLGSAIDDIAISGIFIMYDEALGPFPGYTTVIISSVADGTSKLQVAFRQSTTLPQMAVRVMVDSTWYSWVMFDNVQAALYAGADKTTLVDADVFTILDSEASNVIKKFTWANLKAKVLAAFGVQVAALTAKSPPADADMVAIADSAASNASRKVTFTSIWTWIQSKYAGVTAKAAPVDADTIAFTDTEASNVAKKLTFANLKAWILTAIGKVNAAVGFTLAGGTTSKTLTVSADADSKDIPTAAGKTAADAIGAATGADTGAKIKTLVGDASTSNKGVALLGASGGAAKLTKMPDGAVAVYAQDAWATKDSWAIDNASVDIATTPGVLRLTATATPVISSRSNALLAGKILLVRYRTSGVAWKIRPAGGSDFAILPGATQWGIAVCIIPATIPSTTMGLIRESATAGDWIDIDWIWVGDYSYLSGTLSEEAARIANELGDTAGVGVAASGTITSNGTNVSPGDTVTIAGKVYTYRATVGELVADGDVLIGGSAANSVNYLNLAITRFSPAIYNYNGSFPIYYINAAHPLVTSVYGGSLSNTISAITPGILGNQITLAKSAATLTLSGSTLTGGKDAVGDKIHTQLQTMPATTSKYGAALLAADGGTTAGTVVQGNDSRLGSAANLSWTPVPQFGGVDDDGSYTINHNRYNKLSAKVYVGECQISWTGKGTKTGAFRIRGLPISVVTGSTIFPAGTVYAVSMVGLTAGGGLFVSFNSVNTLGVRTLTTSGSIDLTDANFAATSSIRLKWLAIIA